MNCKPSIQYQRPRMCLHELFEEQVKRVPDASAVSDGAVQVSYADLNTRANQLASYLRTRGVRTGETVAICLKPSVDFAVATLGVLKSGAACVPLDPHYPTDRLLYMLNDVGTHNLITTPGLLPETALVNCKSLYMDDIAGFLCQQPSENLELAVTPEDISYVIYTSGSTGKPRGVLLRHSGLANYNVHAGRLYAMTPDDRVLQFCSLSFDIAVEELFITWVSGATLVIKPAAMPLAVPEFLKWVENHQITVLDLPTAYWHEWVHYLPELEKAVPRGLRLVIVGGEKALGRAYAAWWSSVGNRVRWINTYGPTETSIAATAFEPEYKSPAEIPDVIPIGQPIAGVQVHLLNPSLETVPTGVAGEIFIGGQGVAAGYLNFPELTTQKFIPDPFSIVAGARLYRTGDLASRTSSGDIEFLGRVDDQVKIRGFRVELGEIENAIAKYPNVRQAAVTIREEVSGNKRLLAYIVPDTANDFEPAAIRKHLQEQLPEYMIPAEILVLDAMPLTPNGKIDRRALPYPTVQPCSEVIAANDPLQAQLLNIWQEVLGKKQIGIKDNFFELGGHSLLAARLMHRTGQELGKPLPLALLFEAPTIQQLAAALARDGWSHHWSSLVPIQPHGSHVPLFCVHGIGGNVLGFRELAARMAPNYPFYGLQSRGLDGNDVCHSAIEEMAAHYLAEIRTVQPGGPYHIGGFSFGGLVAYEMAQQLREQNEKVGLVVLFDTYPGNVATRPPSSFARMILRSPLELIRRVPKAIWKRVRRKMRAWRVPEILVRVRESNTLAAERYVLRPYPGKVTLMRASDQSLRAVDPHAEWRELAGDLEIQEIPGDHYDILLPPQVDHLAECLKRCINKAGQEKHTSEPILGNYLRNSTEVLSQTAS